MATHKPDDFGFVPDMTLPERSEPQPDLVPAPTPTHFPPPRQSVWGVGDWVLAPWEPEFLYAGRIVRFDGCRAQVQFEDGDSGMVDLAQLRPLELGEGQLVLCRRNMGRYYAVANVQEFHGDQVAVRFAEDGEVEHTTIAAVRVPVESPGAGAEPVHVANKGIEDDQGRQSLNPYALPDYPDHERAAPKSEGLPSWVVTVLIVVVLALLRSCR
jgi:hypothetical protein